MGDESVRAQLFIAHGFDQLHHHAHQHAHGGHDLVPGAARRVVVVRHRHSRPPGPAHSRLRRRDDDFRPRVRDELLQSPEGGRTPPVAAPVLVLRPSGGLHPHSSGHGYRFGAFERFLQKTDFRLPGHGVLHALHRLFVVDCLGPPHVPVRHEPRPGLRLHDDDARHRDTIGHQDLQLAGDPVGGDRSASPCRCSTPWPSSFCSSSAG